MLTAFWIIGAIGAALLLVSALGAEILDGLLDAVDFTGGFLSTSVIAGFMAAFGLGGGIAISAFGLGAGAAAGVGIGLGLLVGALAGALTRSLVNAPTDRAPGAEDLVGAPGVVVTAIAAGSYGEVMVTVGGHRLKLNALASEAIARGVDVVVTASISDTAVRVRTA